MLRQRPHRGMSDRFGAPVRIGPVWETQGDQASPASPDDSQGGIF